MSLKLSKNIIYYWFPVLPFLGYWVFSYLAFHFGPFVTPELDFATHVYFVSCIVIFVIAYHFGLGTRLTIIDHHFSRDNIVALKLLKITSWLTFIGTMLLLVDRMSSGAGSFYLVKNNMADIREIYAGNTTFLTTFGALPQSFYLVTLASYFYCGMRMLPIPRFVHLLIFATFVCQVLNMILSANRGALLWIALYALFYAGFCIRINLFKVKFIRKNVFKIALAVVCVISSWMYFLYVAQHRVVDTTAMYLGREASHLLKYQFVSDSVDYAALGAQHQLFYYFTHGFVYIDAILKNAPVINLDLLSPLGIRVESQIARFFPGYVFPAKKDILFSVESAGLSRFGWPSTFGAAPAFFGIIGSLLFFYALGFVAGYSTRRCIRSNRLGWLIIVFTIYASLNISFDWILRDFEQYVAMFVGIYLVRKRSGLLTANPVGKYPNADLGL